MSPHFLLLAHRSCTCVDASRGRLARTEGVTAVDDATVQAYAGTDGIVLRYTVHRPDGTQKRGADTMRLDGDGKVVDWRCHYPFDA